MGKLEAKRRRGKGEEWVKFEIKLGRIRKFWTCGQTNEKKKSDFFFSVKFDTTV
jgi:hypothetical protein